MDTHTHTLHGRVISVEEHSGGYDHEVAFSEKPSLRLVFHYDRKIARGTVITVSQDGDIFRLSPNNGIPFARLRGSRTYLYHKSPPLAALV